MPVHQAVHALRRGRSAVRHVLHAVVPAVPLFWCLLPAARARFTRFRTLADERALGNPAASGAGLAFGVLDSADRVRGDRTDLDRHRREVDIATSAHLLAATAARVVLEAGGTRPAAPVVAGTVGRVPGRSRTFVRAGLGG